MAADRLMMRFVHGFIGTVPFLIAWILACGVWFVSGGFGLDPKPFFLLNILMSVWATFTLPILTMSDRWISKQQDAQVEQQAHQLSMLVELAEGQRDLIMSLRAMLQDIDKDVDDIRRNHE